MALLALLRQLWNIPRAIQKGLPLSTAAFSLTSLLFSRWVLSYSLRPHGLQHARLPCPSLSPEVCSNSRPLSRFLNFSSVVSNSLRPREPQHARPPCPSPTPRVYSNSCPLSQWCHPMISSSVVPFSSCPQSFPASGSFQMSQFFTSGGQSIGVSASILPMNIRDWFPLACIGWIIHRMRFNIPYVGYYK